MNDGVNVGDYYDMAKLTPLKGKQMLFLMGKSGKISAYESLTDYYAQKYPRLTGVSMDTGRWDGKPRVIFQYKHPDGEVWEETHKYNDLETAQKHYDAITEAMEKGRENMDIYTATEEAYKRGKEAGEAGAMTWTPGSDIPESVRMALIQKESGTIHLMEQPYLGRAVRMWSGIKAWCEVKAFKPGD